jgi:hypothetical protein
MKIKEANLLNISVFVNHVVIVFWGPNEGDRKRTYISRMFSEYMPTFRVEEPTTQFVQWVQLSSEETVQWHKLWQLPDTNLPRRLQYINVFHQKKNKLWETLSQVLFVESNHLNYPIAMFKFVMVQPWNMGVC